MTWDLTKPENGVRAIQADIRENFQAAHDGIHGDLDENTGTSAPVTASTFTANTGAPDRQLVTIFCNNANPISATLPNDSSLLGKMVQLVRVGAGDITVTAPQALLYPVATAPWPTGLHSTTAAHEALCYQCDRLESVTAAPTRNGSPTLYTNAALNGASTGFVRTIGSGSNRILVVFVTFENSTTEVVSAVEVDSGGGFATIGPAVVTVNHSSRTYSSIYVKLSPVSGSNTIRITTSGALAIIATAVDYENAVQSTPTVFTSATATSQTTVSTTLNSVPIGSVVLDAIVGSSTNPNGVGQSATILHSANHTTPEGMGAAHGEYFPGNAQAALNVARSWSWAGSQSRIAHTMMAITGSANTTAVSWRQISRPPVTA